MRSVSTNSYFAALADYLHEHGLPVALYSHKHSVFRVKREEARSGHGMTQFGRGLSELNVEILCANNLQAKGRVERANRRLQDRRVNELRLAGISDTTAGNAFLRASSRVTTCALPRPLSGPRTSNGRSICPHHA